MGFYLQGWGRSDRGAANPITRLQDGSISGTFELYNYFADILGANGDTIHDIGQPGYFDLIFPELSVGDVITAYSEEDVATATFYVTQVDASSAIKVMVQQFNLGTGDVDTAQFANGAVTYPKIQTISGGTILGNVHGFDDHAQEVPLGNALTFIGDLIVAIDPAILRRDVGNITANEWNLMYDAPHQLTTDPAPAGFMYVIEKFNLRQVFGGLQYTGGGNVAVQYGNAIHGAGVGASGIIGAATINGIAASSALSRVAALGIPTATANGAHLYLSNDTADFATGDGDWEYNITYTTVPV